ncbi:hypothetical protein [Mucilaginibacter phyllosphaerae]|uniref:Outer membrane protein beta-barrel domain-containing protein n=1 Tax=Mucilaginibacter phyllosphaerae TaxID=1812349 RepID=A0A4Y8A642_9SPHI|nr:hypothetical protein [Mucilaginibacter phyllosphaerae]MBB3971105.1 hypothetical protein [Mucilaginibacter phyllosphaerae]TEW63840.1 hypothetical protein E2R65_18925 [Mucilaginibacter phyllosphaerae]GGH22508.1 hypothetical protein GCM10007352_35850 [Mucilaginibacter phyllosphaerae]
MVYKLIKCSRTFAAVIVLVFFLFSARAQTVNPYQAQFSIGVNLGLPTGKLSDTHTIAFGGYLQQTIPLVKTLHLTLNAGYTKFKGESNVNSTVTNQLIIDYPDIDMLAAKAGLRYFLTPQIYLQADAGIALVLNSPQTSYDAAKAFIYSPRAGVQLPVSSRSVIDLGLSYEATNHYGGTYRGNVNSLGIYAAFGF